MVFYVGKVYAVLKGQKAINVQNGSMIVQISYMNLSNNFLSDNAEKKTHYYITTGTEKLQPQPTSLMRRIGTHKTANGTVRDRRRMQWGIKFLDIAFTWFRKTRPNATLKFSHNVKGEWRLRVGCAVRK